LKYSAKREADETQHVRQGLACGGACGRHRADGLAHYFYSFRQMVTLMSAGLNEGSAPDSRNPLAEASTKMRDEEWTKTLADRRVKFTYQELLDDGKFLTAQVEGNEVVYPSYWPMQQTR
jgi:hypothetical protein